MGAEKFHMAVTIDGEDAQQIAGFATLRFAKPDPPGIRLCNFTVTFAD
jgi:hypothetical protein